MKDREATFPKKGIEHVTVPPEFAGQRIDNFLFNKLKKIPKSHVYRIIRKGEVRVNKRRVEASYRLNSGDDIRLPPLRYANKNPLLTPRKEISELLRQRILYEDDHLLVLNKPSGMSVHAGSTVKMGVIETLKYLYPKLTQLELAHRLDAETSGCLIIGKKRRILREIHELLRENRVNKIYWTVTKGVWKKEELTVHLPLVKHFREGGKHVVSIDQKGKAAFTLFAPLKTNKEASLMEATLLTGRTHQIRVHAASQSHPIAGDDRYGDREFNKLVRKAGLKRMFLHARSVDFVLPSLNQHIRVVAPLDLELEEFIHAFFK